jgi:hypothetical protein
VSRVAAKFLRALERCWCCRPHGDEGTDEERQTRCRASQAGRRSEAWDAVEQRVWRLTCTGAGTGFFFHVAFAFRSLSSPAAGSRQGSGRVDRSELVCGGGDGRRLRVTVWGDVTRRRVKCRRGGYSGTVATLYLARCCYLYDSAQSALLGARGSRVGRAGRAGQGRAG